MSTRQPDSLQAVTRRTAFLQAVVEADPDLLHQRALALTGPDIVALYRTTQSLQALLGAMAKSKLLDVLEDLVR